MKRGHLATHASIAFLTLAGSGCELVLGELPIPLEDLTTTGSTTSTTSTAEGGGGQGGATSSTPAGGAGGGTTTSEGGSTTTSTTSTTPTTSTGTGGEGGSCCDCDGDGDDAILCGGGDCDDDNDKVFTDEPVYYTDPSPKNGFDWDCSGIPDYHPDMAQAVDCVALLGLGCPAKEGFLGKTLPMCGQPADWGTCVKVGLECLPQIKEANKKMACK